MDCDEFLILTSGFMFWIFIFWVFTTAVYFIYDIRYTEIPDQMLIPAILSVIILLGIGYI